MVNNLSINSKMFEILSLFRSDYSVKLHIREIARLLKTNHRTILMNLQKLEEANIFHSEIIGKNKLYYLNINNITTREYIRSAEIVKTIAFLEKHFVFKKFIDEVLSKIESFPIIIFGSYAKGQEKKDSDVDVFIFSDHYQYNKEVEKKILDFSRKYKLFFQLKKGTHNDFESGLREKDPLTLEIIKNHVLLNNYEDFIGILWRYAHER